jgi:hypothetical protein
MEDAMGRDLFVTLEAELAVLVKLAGIARRFNDGIDFDRPALLFGPYISGLEVTQSIQYYDAASHLTYPSDRGRDNSVRLAALKPAWVRVYVRSGLIATASTDLTGELTVEHRTGPFLSDWVTVGTLSPRSPGRVTTQSNPAYAIERSSLNATLNFVVPAPMMHGMVRVTARVWRLGDATKAVVDTSQTTVDATLLQTLKLRGIFVAYNGPDPTQNPPVANVVLPAPTVANLQATAAYTLATNPLEAQGQFSSGGTMNWFVPLTGTATEAGGCSAEWAGLNYWISLLKLNDGNRSDVIYYGLLPAAIPIANVGGCALHGVSAGPDTFGPTMAHEIGHAAGLGHGPCGVTGGVDGKYPAYEPYDPKDTPMASIGEYGLDIGDGTIHPPTEKDYMSYCSPNFWISLYHYARLCYNERFTPRTVGTQRYRPPDLVDPFLWPWEYIPDPPPYEIGPNLRPRVESLIALVGLVDAERVLGVKSVMRIQALRSSNAGAIRTPFVAELIGESGQVVARAPVMRPIARGHGCGCDGDQSDPEAGPYVFEALLTDAEPGRRLRIVKRSTDDEASREVWTRTAPARRPRVSRFTVKVERRMGVATWAAAGAGEDPLEYAIQFSKDKGRSWNGLTVGLRDKTYRLALTDLPTGPVIFRLLAHDGFFTATRLSRPVMLPSRPPAVSILHPQPGQAIFAGVPMRLWGGVMTADGTPIEADVCRWRLDGRQVARGVDEFIDAPAPGDHRCTFTVQSREGRAEVSVVFRTVDPAETDQTRLGPRPSGSTATAKKAARKRVGSRKRRR